MTTDRQESWLKRNFGREGNPKRARYVRIASALVLVSIGLNQLLPEEGSAAALSWVLPAAALLFAIFFTVLAYREPHRPAD